MTMLLQFRWEYNFSTIPAKVFAIPNSVFIFDYCHNHWKTDCKNCELNKLMKESGNSHFILGSRTKQMLISPSANISIS